MIIPCLEIQYGAHTNLHGKRIIEIVAKLLSFLIPKICPTTLS
nr:MAG TPA: hypothetical protein [Caudoviricetes sp.]